mgnify:CR=1 FL=1
MSELIHYQKLRGGEQIVTTKQLNKIAHEFILKNRDSLLLADPVLLIGKHVHYFLCVDKFNEAITCLKEKKRTEAQDILVKLIDTFPVKKSDEDLVPIYNFQNTFEILLQHI